MDEEELQEVLPSVSLQTWHRTATATGLDLQVPLAQQ